MNAIARGMRILPHLVVGTTAVALLVAIALAHRYSPVQVSHLADVFVHSLHGPGFAAVAIGIFAALRLYRNCPSNYLYAGTAAMAIGVLAEAAQIPGPRDAELIDLVVDAIGIISGLGFIAMFDARYRSFPLAIITVLALVVAAGPTLFYGYAWISQQRAAPTLLSFEHRWERPIFGQPGPHHPDMLPAPPGWPLEGTVALAEETDRGRALVRVTPYPDWTGYSALSFIAASGSGMPTKIRVSIIDIRPTDESDTNRFRENFDIGAQPTRITIPLDKLREISNGRPFDLAHIEAIFLNAVEPGSDTSVYLDDFRLE